MGNVVAPATRDWRTIVTDTDRERLRDWRTAFVDALRAARTSGQSAEIARERGFSDDGYRVVINTNSDGGQTVFHLHVHLLAGRPFVFPPG